MEPVLTDLELDLREIKYLLDVLSREPDSMLQKVAVRRVRQMQTHLGVLLQEIEGIITEEKKDIATTIDEAIVQPVSLTEPDVQPFINIPVQEEIPEPLDDIQPEPVDMNKERMEKITEIHTSELKSLGDRMKPATDLKGSLTLNDRFLYSRELFNGDMEHMDSVLLQISQMESLENVLSFLESILSMDEENETYRELLDRIRKYFD